MTKTEKNSAAPDSKPPVRLACIEVSSFRRLKNTRVHLDASTTVLVGANNSGKTSIVTVLRNFLGEGGAFKAFDISLCHWPKLRELSVQWESLIEDPSTVATDIETWRAQLIQLQGCMPFVDLWFDAKEGAFHYVAPFITSLKWEGGVVGVRIQLEPASTVEELQALAWKYREARAPVEKLEKAGHAWPIDVLDYWLRHSNHLGKLVAYRLDPSLGPLALSPQPEPQQLTEHAEPVELAYVDRLIRVDLIPAQRGLGSDEEDSRIDGSISRPGMFSNQLLKYARQHLNVATSGSANREDLMMAIAKAQADLDNSIVTALQPSMDDVKILGYPGLNDPQKIHFRTRIQTADLLSHSTAIQYQQEHGGVDELLPENSIGLGYQNLQSLSFQLVSFRSARLNPPKGSPAAVHLVMLEEPEAHLHVQVQRVFPQKAHALISPDATLYGNLGAQLLICTHSSHLAHADRFTRLRYVRRVPRNDSNKMSCTEVINLADAFGTDDETRIFAERYFRVQHTDLLFADAAVFVEGTAERMLIPLFIERDFPELSKKYISLLDIGGSHAHRLRPLVERLGIPTAVITDLDPVVPRKTDKGRTVRAAVHIAGQEDLECGNDTLTSWHPQLNDFQAFRAPTPAQLEWASDTGLKVRFAWQLPVVAASNQWPSSFEDALVLSNIKWFEELEKLEKLEKLETESAKDGGRKKALRGEIRKVVDAVVDHPKHDELLEALHKLLHSRKFSKGDFAATIFERISNGEAIVCPPYIADALVWLETELTPSTKPSLPKDHMPAAKPATSVAVAV